MNPTSMNKCIILIINFSINFQLNFNLLSEITRENFEFLIRDVTHCQLSVEPIEWKKSSLPAQNPRLGPGRKRRTTGTHKELETLFQGFWFKSEKEARNFYSALCAPPISAAFELLWSYDRFPIGANSHSWSRDG